MKQVRVGLIGTGFSAQLHVDAFAKVAGVEVAVVAVVDHHRERAKAFAAEHGIARVYDDYRELLGDDAVDVVSVCVPNAAHAEVAVAAAEAGKHIICEKPLTGFFAADAPAADALQGALDTADEILAAADRHGVRFCYAENWVYAPSVTKAKALLAASGGAILDIRAEESHSGSHAPASRRRETAGGGALLVLGSHAIGGAVHLKNDEGRRRDGEPVRVASVTADVADLTKTPAFGSAPASRLVSEWVDVESWANAVLTFTDGTKAVVTASFGMLGGIRNTMEIYSTNSVLACNMTPSDSMKAYAPDPAVFGSEYLAEKLETKGGWSFPAPDEDWIRGYPQEMQDFAECVADDRAPVSDGRLARDVVEVVYAAYLSAETGHRVDLPVTGP